MERLKFRSTYEWSYRNDFGGNDRKPGNWRIQRPVVNVEKCCQCGWCYLYCPGGCMEYNGTHFVPNLDYCKGCGICSRECLVSAIRMIREVEQ